MATTLKQRYESRRLDELSKRLARLDKQIINESLLLEFNKEMIEKAAKHLNALSGIQMPTESLNKAKEAAINAIRSSMSGKSKGTWDRIKQFFGKDPATWQSAMSFVASMEELGNILPKILKIWPENAEALADEQREALSQVLTKGLAKSSKPWVSEYDVDLDTVVKELITVDRNEIEKFSSSVQNKLRGADDLATFMSQRAAQKSTKQKTEPKADDQAKQPEKTDQTTPATTPTSSQPTTQPEQKPAGKVFSREDAGEIAKHIASKRPDVIDAKTAEAVIAALMDTKYKITAENRIRTPNKKP